MILDSIKIIKSLKPIQYLGAKDRVLDSIMKHSEGLYNGGYVLDLFAGSSIVSQGYSSLGAKVIANDIQAFSADISRALLKIDFNSEDFNLDLAAVLVKNEGFQHYLSTYSEFIFAEKKFISDKKSSELLSLYSNFPVYWKRNMKYEPAIQQIFDNVKCNIGNSSLEIAPLFTVLYAGTYFGILQCLEIDEIRWNIEQLYKNKMITSWQYSFYLTCLHSTISAIVNSAGKHFAQPIKQANIKNNNLMEDRLYKNRSISVRHLFEEKALLLKQELKGRTISVGNLVTIKSMEEIITSQDEFNEIDLIYADPPYTAQQYSRFYHIPDILSRYIVPELQIHKGVVTVGIYPENKFKSRFCSIRQAPEAFKDMFRLAKSLNSNLILSYSHSKKSGGNKRMMSLESLKNLASEILPEYSLIIEELDLDYKQLNKKDSMNASEDKEILLILKKQINNDSKIPR